MSMVRLELLFPIMESVDIEKKTLIQQKQNTIVAKFQGLFLWQNTHFYSFIE